MAKKAPRDWKVIQDLHNCITVDFEKKLIRCPEGTWIRYESATSLFIYPDEETFRRASA